MRSQSGQSNKTCVTAAGRCGLRYNDAEAEAVLSVVIRGCLEKAVHGGRVPKGQYHLAVRERRAAHTAERGTLRLGYQERGKLLEAL